MRITPKIAQEMISVLDEVREEIQKENKNSKQEYPYAEWERKRELVKERLKKLPRVHRKSGLYDNHPKDNRP